MRLPRSAYTSRHWRMHEIAPDFTVEDVWELPIRGDRDELPRVVDAIFGSAFPDEAPAVVRVLWAARWKIGALLGWDDVGGGLDERVPSLRQRLPDDLRPDADVRVDPFTLVFETEDEFAAELANRTVHTAMHLGWLPGDAGRYVCRMTVLVRPNGRLGAFYMTAIKPLRLLFVDPALLRSIGRRWEASASAR
ncbi:DUF2867 domain-containing protein [Brevibacterium casei]|uniref:DUF2867 domain-containing protein n=1 Tax=Brevibacterium casei TaxID=33889 RepID=UPI000E64CF58|nr:DUF2867 domain-containing protein [Brevibacterium casei]MCT1448170.1 DUF2867 domain-containing protein [Brevibacterium casei]